MGSPEEFWPNFCSDDLPSPPAAGGGSSVAEEVARSLGMPFVGTGGDGLAGLDIKHMDADQLINLSLLSDESGVKEVGVDIDGALTFRTVGDGDGLGGCDVYYQIQSYTYVEACTGVMVTGGKPRPQRRAAEFVDIWQDGVKEVYNADWVSENGMSETFSNYATIVFEDPFLSTSYKDGIDNLYNVTSPWESVIGYARYIDWPGSESSPETTVSRSDNSTIPILVSGGENSGSYNADIGILVKKVAGESAEGGIPINIPESFQYTTIRGNTLNKLIGIRSIIIVGKKLDSLMGIPIDDAAAVSADPEEAKIIARISSDTDSMYELKEGDHYVITYNEGRPSIVFASNSRANDPATFGINVSLLIDQDSAYMPGEHLNGVSVLPTGGTDGYLVKQVIALVNVQTPCINIYDPRPGKAIDIAIELQYKLAALLIVDEPAPVAFNGSIVDQSDGMVDHDPTTTQSFSDTAYEQSLASMHGGGVSVTMSHLDAGGCAALSSTLLSHLNRGNGTVTTYVCGPNSTPSLGGFGGDSSSVVNDIVYSYSDSNSYTVSVTTGPVLLGGVTNVTDSITKKKTENVPSNGVVIQDMGNHVHFKVRLDACGIAPVVALNTAPAVIRVGDIVQCTLYNNPVEQ